MKEKERSSSLPMSGAIEVGGCKEIEVSRGSVFENAHGQYVPCVLGVEIGSACAEVGGHRFARITLRLVAISCLGHWSSILHRRVCVYIYL